jgi:hypothetical protein
VLGPEIRTGDRAPATLVPSAAEQSLAPREMVVRIAGERMYLWRVAITKARFSTYWFSVGAHKLVTETVGVKHLRAILGVSMGGMNAWQWAEAYPDAMNGVMPVVSSALGRPRARLHEGIRRGGADPGIRVGTHRRWQQLLSIQCITA